MWRRIAVMSSSVSTSSATMKPYGPIASRTKALRMVLSRSPTACGRTSGQSRYAITGPAYYPTNVILSWPTGAGVCVTTTHLVQGGLGAGQHHITLLPTRDSVTALTRIMETTSTTAAPGPPATAASRPWAIEAHKPSATPASAPIATSTAATGAPLLSRPGLLDPEGTCWLVKYMSVKGFNSCFCLDAQGHLDKREAFGAARIAIMDHMDLLDLAMSFECLA